MLELLRHYGMRPRACVWELTLACNMRCKHCGSHAGPKRDNELDLETCLDIADQLAELGGDRVTLGGGEPTLSPHWHQLGRRLTDRGLRVNIISNGWEWGEREVERALSAGLVAVAFSLDGLEAAHDHMRRPGSFERVLKAIDLSRAAGLPAAVNTTITSANCRSLCEIYTLLAEHDVFAWQLQIGTPTGEFRGHPELLLAPEELLWLIPAIAELRQQASRPKVAPADDIGYYGRFESALRDKDSEIPFWIGCPAGCQVIGIESNGNVKGCLSLPSEMHGEERFVEGNLRKDRLADIWNRKGAFAFNREFKEADLGGFCAVCRYRRFCRGGCSWTSFGATATCADNPYCLHRQAVEHDRLDLLSDPPTDEELAFFGRVRDPASAATSAVSAVTAKPRPPLPEPVELGPIHALVIFSDDPQALAEWYRAAFDLCPTYESADFIGLASPSARVTLFIQRTSEGHTPGPGGVRPHFTVADCHLAVAGLLARGAEIVLPLTDTGAEWVAAIRDPAGNVLGLLQPKPAAPE